SCEEKTNRRVQREACGQREHGNWKKPTEGLGIDQESIPDPVEARKKIAEPEAPTGTSGCKGCTGSCSRGAIDEPHDERKRDERDEPAREISSPRAQHE